MTPRSALWRLLLAATVAAILLVAAVRAIDRPAPGDTHDISAEFTDVAGLHPGADVRIRGVQVGKVKSIALERSDGRSFAVVEISLVKKYGIVADTRLAVKYQALTGLRYIDITGAAVGPQVHDSLSRVPLSMTQPSFDITRLFNGLQPVLTTLSPDEINKFVDNATLLLQGDGSGLGPMLDSIRALTAYASDRQQVIATVMKNLNSLSSEIGGRSPQFVQILDWLNRPIDAAISVLDEFRKSELYGPTFTSAVIRLLDNIGIVPGLDLDKMLGEAFTSVGDAAAALRALPNLIEGLSAPAPNGGPLKCSHGHVQLPLALQVLLNGQKVILCKPA